MGNLLWLDGFDDYNVTSGNQGNAYYNVTQFSGQVAGRGGGFAVKGGATKTLPGEFQEITLGFAFNMLGYAHADTAPALMGFGNLISAFGFQLLHYEDNATATAAVVGMDGHLVVTVTAGGSYYDPVNPPSVTITNTHSGGGTYTSASTSVSGNSVISVTVVGSSGYDPLHPPSVAIAPGGRAFRVRITNRSFSNPAPGPPSAKFIGLNEWNYFELNVKTSTNFVLGEPYATVDYKLKVNDEVWLNDSINSNVNIQSQTDFNIAQVGFDAGSNLIDDLYMTDGEFLADGLPLGLKIATLRPVASTLSDFTPNVGGAQNWEMVDDIFPDDDVTTVST